MAKALRISSTKNSVTECKQVCAKSSFELIELTSLVTIVIGDRTLIIAQRVSLFVQVLELTVLTNCF